MKGKIRKRSVIIFGTGDSLRIPTVSANAGFVRAAQHQVSLQCVIPLTEFESNIFMSMCKFQGVNFVAILHESRALTEAKEIRAEQN